MQDTWKPTAAGVLAIVGGTFKMLTALGACLYLGNMPSLDIPPLATAAIVAALMAPGVVAVVGGSFALRRRRWGLALAGAICAIVPPLFTLGILSTVWVAISRREFH